MLENNIVRPDPRLHWARLDQAARNAAYDNNAATADSASRVDARNQASLAFRAAFPGSLDLRYADTSGGFIDLFPGKDPLAPCMVFLHGGYWQRNSRELFACFAEGILARGWSVAMQGYTLTPRMHLAEIVDEVGTGLDWLAENGSAHGVAGPLLIAGWSAGAHLAVMQLKHPGVTAGLAISGVYDLEPIRDTNLNEALQLSEAEISTLSPLRLPVVQKPLCIVYGANELPALVHDSLNLAARRQASCAVTKLVAISGADHFSILDGFRAPEGDLVQLALDLI